MSEALATSRLERIIGAVLRVGGISSTVCFAIGLLLSLTSVAPAAATLLLHAGVIVLLATPFVRVMVSLAEYVSRRDWLFVALTAVVFAQLIGSVILALIFEKRL